jgi:N-acetylglucosaminyldiphosphoundecaprenol N-acetyl-beta-D-mannosaminyltransferase
LGARPGVVEACRQRLRERFPKLRVAGAHDGHFTAEGEKSILSDINEKQPAILLVALGSPLQEEWISRNAARLNVGVCLAVGGLFDFIAGVRKRAPSWMRATRIEWLYRFFQDPLSKWNRIVVEIPAFLLELAALRLVLPRVDPLLKHQAFLS